MSYFHPSPFLRRVLALDALSCAAMGIMLTVGAGFLARLLDLPHTLLTYAGLVLLPCAALLGFMASREVLARPLVWAVIALNAVWVVESLITLVSGSVTPNVLGYAFVIGQALVVAVLAELEFLGLKRSVGATA